MDKETTTTTTTTEHDDVILERFQEFLRFETVSATASTTGAYVDCAAFLKDQLEALGCLTKVWYLPEAPDHSPVVIGFWEGSDPTLPVILLNSHYDVVPADAEAWTVPPFEGIRKDGKIYGRGAQDMKCVCLQYIEALRRIHHQHQNGEKQKFVPTRSIYLTFVPDEEIGGSGMAAFLDSSLYRSLPGIALALDEGLASTDNCMDVFYGERLPWWIDITATGPTGHGSRFIENTAVEQLLELTQKALAFRQGQKDLLGIENPEEHQCTHVRMAQKQLGDVTSLNITTLQAGVPVGNTYAYNCVPPQAKCSLDIRISPHMDPQEMKDLLDSWCQECSSSSSSSSSPDDTANPTIPVSKVTWSYLKDQNSAMHHATTETDRKKNPWYALFEDTLQDQQQEQTSPRGFGSITLRPQVFPAATDSRFLRALGIRALGFSPMRNTEILLHEHDEYILESNYLEGIAVYTTLIPALASQGKDFEETYE